MRRDERIYLFAQGRIALAGVAQERVARARVTRQRRVKNLGDLPPAIGRHHVRRPFSAAYSHARATCQSRSTVATEMPST